MAYLTRIIQAVVLAMWAPAAAFAAVLAATGAETSPLNVPAALLVATVLFSTLMGATTLAHRLITELRANPDKPLVYPGLYSVAHMLGSWSAGSMCFVVAMSQQAGVWTVLGAVMAGSFGGAKTLEFMAERWLPTVAPKEGGA